MREIKFRGWHTVQKEMFSAETMAADQLTLLTTGTFINVSGDSTRLSIIYPKDKFIPLQYTGLKDKNGVEIYERDRCQECFYISHFIEDKEQGWRKLHEGRKGHWETTERRDVFEVSSIEDIYKRIWELREIVAEKDREILESGGYFEVIGNIYENPELLEVKA